MNDWKAFGQTDDGSLPFEGCIQGTAYECQFGAIEPAGTLSAASRAEYAVNTQFLNWGVNCEPGDATFRSCPTARQSDGYPLGQIILYGSMVTITDSQRPTLRVGGPLLTPGWWRPGDVVTYDASDATGIRGARLAIAGRTTRDPRPCDYRRPAPCSNVSARRLVVPAGIPDGQHASQVVAEDAAGNAAVAQRTISIDGTPPNALLERASGRSIVLWLTDDASGVASATLEVRRNSTEPYRTLNAALENGKLRATSTATVRRGSTCASPSATTRATSPRATRRGCRRRARRSAAVPQSALRPREDPVRPPRDAARPPHALRRPALRGPDDRRDFRGPKRGAEAMPAGSAVTDRRGRFSLAVPAGPSRAYRLVSPASGGALGSAPGRLRPRARVEHDPRLPDTPLHTGRVRFSGRLRTRGQRIPGRGLVLVLQGPRARQVAHVRGHANEPKGPLARLATPSAAGRALPDPRPHPAPGRLPVRARLLASADHPGRLRVGGECTQSTA